MQERRAGKVQPEELRDWVIFVLEGSIDNTVHQIGLLLGHLLEIPELWQRVRCDPALMLSVVEESLRLDSRVRAIHRSAVEDIDIAGDIILAQTDMFFWIRAAHLDPRAFDTPEQFNVDRPRKPGPLLFGGGAYSCLSQWMARTEAQEVLRGVIEHFPDIRLAGAVERSIDLFALAVDRLPVLLNG